MAGGPSSWRSMVTALTAQGIALASSSQPGCRCLSHLKPSRRTSRNQLSSQPRSGVPPTAPALLPPRQASRTRPLPDVRDRFVSPLAASRRRSLALPRSLPALTQSACQHHTSSLSDWLHLGLPIIGLTAPATKGKLLGDWLRGKLRERSPSPSPNGKSTSGS